MSALDPTHDVETCFNSQCECKFRDAELARMDDEARRGLERCWNCAALVDEGDVETMRGGDRWCSACRDGSGPVRMLTVDGA